MAWLKTGGGGEKVVTGTFEISGGIISSVDVGFKPKKIYLTCYVSQTRMTTVVYDEDISTTSSIVAVRNNTTHNVTEYLFTNTAGGIMTEVNNTGFKYRGGNAFNGNSMTYVALG